MSAIAHALSRVRRPRGNVRGDSYVLGGGLNEVDSPLSVPPGELIAVSNYEPRLRQGYSRLTGYECFDGQDRPSDQGYLLVNYDAASSTFAVDDEVETDSLPGDGRVLAVVENDGTATNNAPFSYDLDNWDSYTGASGVDAGIIGPDKWNASGSLNAWKLVEDGGLSEHYVEEVYSGISNTETWTISVYVLDPDFLPPVERSKCRVTVLDQTGKLVDVWYDLSAEAVLNPGNEVTTGVTGSYVADKSGIVSAVETWFRFELTFTARATEDHIVRVAILDDSGTQYYTGDGASGLHVTGLQIEQASTVYDYIETNGAAASVGGGYLVLDNVTGLFEDDDQLRIKGSADPYRMTVNGDGIANGAPTVALDRHYKELAAIKQRALIAAVPGEGSVLGVCLYDGDLYAIRNAVGGATAVMHKSTSSGWAAVDLGNILNFDAGTGEIVVGDTVTGGTSTAFATVRKVVITSGVWGTDAAGYLVLGTITNGPYQNNENLDVSGTEALADGVNAAQTALLPGGKYEFRVHNFYGHTSQRAMYFVNSVNQAVEYESVTGSFAYIDTGMTDDTPNHLEVYDEQLVLSFPGGSIQNSAPNGPFTWDVKLGAAEVGVGDEVTALLHMPGSALFAFTRDEIHYFVGVLGDAASTAHDKFAQSTGGYEWTILPIGQGVFLDDRGFSTLATVDRKGDYLSTTISQKIPKTLKKLQRIVTDSVINRKRSLARYFTNTATGSEMISIGFSGATPTGFTTSKLPITVNCSCSGEDGSGQERTFLGGADGFVYEFDVGWNFNGAAITAYTVPAFNHQQSPTRVKRYRRAQMEIDSEGEVTLKISSLVSGGDRAYAQQGHTDTTVQGGGGLWNVDNWNEFRWSQGGIIPVGFVKLESSGLNISLVSWHEEIEELPHDLNSVVLHYSPRRIERRTLAYP